MTDGGLHRLGESEEDRKSYLKNKINELQRNSVKSKFIFTFIKEQETDVAILCKSINIPSLILNDIDSYNDCFGHYVNLINQVGGN